MLFPILDTNGLRPLRCSLLVGWQDSNPAGPGEATEGSRKCSASVRSSIWLDRLDNDRPFHFAVLMSPMIAFVWLRLARKHVNSLQDGGLSKWKVE